MEKAATAAELQNMYRMGRLADADRQARYTLQAIKGEGKCWRCLPSNNCDKDRHAALAGRALTETILSSCHLEGTGFVAWAIAGMGRRAMSSMSARRAHVSAGKRISVDGDRFDSKRLLGAILFVDLDGLHPGQCGKALVADDVAEDGVETVEMRGLIEGDEEL